MRYTEQNLLQELMTLLRERLPRAWDLSLEKTDGFGKPHLDAELTLRASNGIASRIPVIAKNTDNSGIANWLARHIALQSEQCLSITQWLLVSPYISPMMRARLQGAGISYADMTGNLSFTCNDPAVFLRQEGASTNPWRETQHLQSLKGRGAGRAVRAICDIRPPYGIRDLAQETATSAPTITRVAQLLEAEALLQRSPAGKILDVQWKQIILRWTQDYNFITTNYTKTFLEPRGLDALLGKLRLVNFRYAMTGSFATRPLAAIAASRLAALYVPDIAEAAAQLRLHPADRGANVLLVEPFDPVVFERTTQIDDLTYAAVTQVAADLLTSPGRGPEEGEWLLEWMEQNEHIWRARSSHHTSAKSAA